jgi:hypothetical protein
MDPEEINFRNILQNHRIKKCTIDVANVRAMLAIGANPEYRLTENDSITMTGYPIINSKTKQQQLSYSINHVHPTNKLTALLNRHYAGNSEPSREFVIQFETWAKEIFFKKIHVIDFDKIEEPSAKRWIEAHPDASPAQKRDITYAWNHFMNYGTDHETFDYDRNPPVYSSFTKSGEENNVLVNDSDDMATVYTKTDARPRNINSLPIEYMFGPALTQVLIKLLSDLDAGFTYKATGELYTNRYANITDATVSNCCDASQWDSTLDALFRKIIKQNVIIPAMKTLERKSDWNRSQTRLAIRFYGATSFINELTVGTQRVLTILVKGTMLSGDPATTLINTETHLMLQHYVRYLSGHPTSLAVTRADYMNKLDIPECVASSDDGDMHYHINAHQDIIAAQDTVFIAPNNANMRHGCGIKLKSRIVMTGADIRLEFCSKTTLVDHNGQHHIIRDFRKMILNSRCMTSTDKKLLQTPKRHAHAVYLSNREYTDHFCIDLYRGRHYKTGRDKRMQRFINEKHKSLWNPHTEQNFIGNVAAEISRFLRMKYKVNVTEDDVNQFLKYIT